jgi:hypothetical protein
VTGTLNLSDQIYMRPRQSNSVTLSGRVDEARRRCLAYGIGSAVVALIFSMAKREVTFLSDTDAISFL